MPEACYSPSQQPTATAASTPLVSNLAAQKQSSPLQGAAQQWPYGPSNHCLTWMSQGPASGSIAHATGAAAGGRRTASISNPPRQSQDIRAQAVPNPPRPSQVIRAQALPSQRLIRDLGERGLGRVRGSLPAEPAPSTPSPAARTLGVPALSPPRAAASGRIYLLEGARSHAGACGAGSHAGQNAHAPRAMQGQDPLQQQQQQPCRWKHWRARRHPCTAACASP